MAIVVEDGTGLENSNSYASSVEAKAYHADRGNTAWAAAASADQTAALIKATGYIDGQYFTRFPGKFQLKTIQALQWPRSDAVDRNGLSLAGIPKSVKVATFEAALIFLSTDIVAPREHGGAIKEESIGPIKTVYSDGASNETTYPAIELALKPILSGTSGGVRVTR